MKHIKKFNTSSMYNAYIVGSEFVTPNVSLIEDEYTLHYNPYISPVLGPPTFMSILWEDSNGNLSYSNNVLPTSNGKTPIGVCVAPTGFFGQNESARWVSLKLMSKDNPDAGSSIYDSDITELSLASTYNGAYNNVTTQIDKYWKDSPEYNGYVYNYITSITIGNNSRLGTEGEISPNLLTSNNEWNLLELGNKNEYILTDVNGKSKCQEWLNGEYTYIRRTDWRTGSLTEVESENLKDWDSDSLDPIALFCCLRYHTLGTNAGDWYLPAAGELAILTNFSEEFNSLLSSINNLYPLYSISSLQYTSYNQLDNFSFLTITQTNGPDDHIMVTCNMLSKRFDMSDIGYTQNVLAFLQYDF